MAKKVGFLKLTLLGLIGAIAGAVPAVLLRPSYPPGHPWYSPNAAIGKPTLPTMITNGLLGHDPTDRKALIYFVGGIVLGGLIGIYLAYLTSRKKT
jgi:hypothetical protein